MQLNLIVKCKLQFFFKSSNSKETLIDLWHISNGGKLCVLFKRSKCDRAAISTLKNLMMSMKRKVPTSKDQRCSVAPPTAASSRQLPLLRKASPSLSKNENQQNKSWLDMYTGSPSVPQSSMNALIEQYKSAQSYFLPAQSALTCKTGFFFFLSLKGGSWCFWLRYPTWTINIQSEELLWVEGGEWTGKYLVYHRTQTCASPHAHEHTHTPDSCTSNLPSSL